MSFATALSAASAIASFVFGGGTVQLGSVSFTGLATPEKINFGGRHATTVHKLIGGARIIDAMGADDAAISWSGYFDGPIASYNAQAVDQLRMAGQPVPLSWPGFSRTVIVSQFDCSYERGGWLLPYRVTCIVVPAQADAGGESLLGSVAGDIASSLGLPDILSAAAPVLQTAQSAIQAVQSVMPIAGILTGGSAAFLNVTGALTTASGVVSAGIGAAENGMSALLSGAASVSSVLGTLNPATAVSNLQTAMTGAASLAGLTNMGGFIARAANNLGLGANNALGQPGGSELVTGGLY